MARQHILHIRVSNELYELYKRVAKRRGVATAQFIREAAMKDGLVDEIRAGGLPEYDPDLVKLIEEAASRLGFEEADEDFKLASMRAEQGRKTRARKAQAENGNGTGNGKAALQSQ